MNHVQPIRNRLPLILLAALAALTAFTLIGCPQAVLTNDLADEYADGGSSADDNENDTDDEGGDDTGTDDAIIDIADIPGVTPPAYGESPVTEITETDQYTGTVSWSPDDNPFESGTEYTATITLTTKDEFTLTGVDADFFEVGGADSVSNAADSGVVTAVFPATKYVLGDFALGDDGPAGGIIFYVDTADEHDWTYLEVAPAETEWTGKNWGDEGTNIGDDDENSPPELTGLGDGKANTEAIVAHMEGNSITGTAAQLCDALVHDHEGTTYDDWFLPSLDELQEIWWNLVSDQSSENDGQGVPRADRLGDFNVSTSYWSSSEVSGNSARSQFFENGNQNYYLKDGNSIRVRAIRAF